jgi:glycosyltransferase involved in cell wall biosynthesis
MAGAEERERSGGAQACDVAAEIGAVFDRFLAADVLRNPRLLMDPAVSVLMSVYNGEENLVEAVGSILGQTFADFEFIVVDDGSTDRSLSILKAFEKKDARLKVISRPNSGIAGALNDAIAVARGEFFARMDADDVAVPTRFEKQIAFLKENPTCVLLGSRVMLIEPYGTPIYETQQPLEDERIVDQMLKGDGWAVLHPSAMMRADAVRAVGGYRADRVPIEDLDLFLRLTETGQVANLPEILLHYRQHLQSTNHLRFAEQEAKKRACVAEAYAKRGAVIPADWAPPPRRRMTAVAELSQWAWIALRKKNITAARRHAIAVVKRAPTAVSSWRLLFCAMRGR